MEIIKDKIYDVYYSENESNFQRKVRERIHWICQNVSGDTVLDIGCSQGITAILLGREGKKVLGLDLSESAIKDALENLDKEEEETKSCVQFEKANFMLKDFNEQYNTVILGEVLEHINDIHAFFNKASSLLKENGTLIVTTPFGINDFIDHKRTFYLFDFLRLQNHEMSITDIKFFGKWIGVIYKKKNEAVLKIDEGLLEKLEAAFYNIERELVNSQKKLTKKIKSNEEALKKLQQDNKSRAKIEEFENEIKYLLREHSELKSYKQRYLDEKVEKVKIQRKLLEQYKREEELLKANKILSDKIHKLEGRYNNLRNSKLGKLTIRYWELRNKKRRN